MSWLSRQWVNWIRFTPLGWGNIPGLAANIATSMWKRAGGSVGSSSSGDFLHQVGDNLGSILKQLLTGDSAANLIKWLTHSGQTDESKETMANQLANQQVLNAEEYQRKIDFYNTFESPAAMVRQYQEAGLNPMMLAGSGAGQSATGGVGTPGSAGTAGPGAGNLLSAISAIAGLSMQQKRLQVEQMDAETRRFDAETRRTQSADYMAYLRSITRKTDTETEQLVQLFPAKKENLVAQTDLLRGYLNSEEVRQRLMQSGIDLNKAQEALTLRQEAIVAAQEKYADRYFKAAAELEEISAKLAGVQYSFEKDTLEKRKAALEYQMYNMLYEAALNAKAFQNFQPAQIREWIKTGAQVVGAVAGAAVGAGSLAGASQARGMYQASQFQHSMSPGGAYMENGILYPSMFSPR